jgi:hypothetical protein
VNISPESKQRQVEAGKKNLSEYQRRIAVAQQGADDRADQFRVSMLAELGAEITAVERALVDSAAVSIRVIRLAEAQLKLVPSRLHKKQGLSASICVHQSSLLRALGKLELALKSRKAKPARSVAELLAAHRRESPTEGQAKSNNEEPR